MIDRRTLLRNAMVASVFYGMAGRASAAKDINLRLYWWGSQERANRTFAVAELFAKGNPGITVTGEVASGDYWPKLSTMMVGGNMPDLIQCDPATLPDYARRGAMLPLDQYIPSVISENEFANGVSKLGVVAGKTYGIPLGLNAVSLFYDKDVFDKVGIALPTWGTTWDEIGEIALEISKSSGKQNFWGMADASRYIFVFDVWLNQRGKTLYTEEGQFGFTLEDAKEWYAYWEKLNKSGATVAADVMSADNQYIETNPMVRGSTAISFTYSNQLISYQALLPQHIGITTLPLAAKDGKAGLFYRPALIWSITKDSKNPEDAAKLINFFVNDIEAGKILGIERGVPVNLQVRAAVAPSLTPVEGATLDYIDFIADKVNPFPPQPPVGATEFDYQVFRPIADQLLFGRITVDEAASNMMSRGKRAMRM